MSDSVGNELARRSDTVPADDDCPECGGTIWKCDGDDICGDCSVIRGSGRARSTQSQWEQFFDDRSEHWNSDAIRCVGGFPWVYDWVSSDDVDGTVQELPADEFYH